MNQDLRNKLRNVVTQCRRLLEESISQELEGKYNIFARKDQVTADPGAKMSHLSEEEQESRKDILDHFAHIKARGFKPKEALEQLIREIAFTHLNRLCAYKMMEAREVYVGGQKFREAVSRGVNSNGVKFYLAEHPEDERLFNTGQQDVAYRHYLDWLGGQLSDEIGVLFSPTDPANRLYPKQKTLDEALDLLNGGGIKAEETDLREQWPQIWAQDETIGWVYQYFTPKELRDQARKESQAPRNSYELAFRNQFFTPRYVVEFLTDNTLGRIWYEMRKGDTRLKDQCRYMVRRPTDVFLRDPERPLAGPPKAAWLKAAVRGDFSQMPEEPEIEDLSDFSLSQDGYELCEKLGFGDLNDWAPPRIEAFEERGELPSSSIELWLLCFCFQRRWGRATYQDPIDELKWREVYRALRAALIDTGESLSQEELLRQAVYIPHRPKKDPRELKILDPACGSGHFLLYCFDLLLTIYEEAYDDRDLGPVLQQAYPTLEALRRDVPRLILAHNLHGIDIDLRASQIAALALWLRCQRAYQEMGLKKDRPRITRSNFVCAEPMPGEEQMLKEFVSQLEPKVLGQVVEVVFDKMKLAGEAGSLLKIEEEIRDTLDDAKKQFVRDSTRAKDKQGRTFLFTQAEMRRVKDGPEQLSLFDLSDITDEQFFEQAEAKVIEALRAYAEKAQGGQRLQKRLFAEDAVRGFAFIDVCQKRYDVVLMNPPFGEASKISKSLIDRVYPRTKNDIYAAFVELGIARLLLGGILGAITSRTGFFLSSFQKWREEVLLYDAKPTVFGDLGHGVLDTAMVETAFYCLLKRSATVTTKFLRLLEAEDKKKYLEKAVKAINQFKQMSYIFEVDPISFRKIAGSPFSYWVSDRVRSVFEQLECLESKGRAVRQGLITGDDFRFIRCWWEVSPENTLSALDAPSWHGKQRAFQDYCRRATFERRGWVPFAKGGEYSPFYSDLHLVVNWSRDGAEIRNITDDITGKKASRPQNTDFYFRSGLTWPRRTTSGISIRPLQAGAIFSDKGPTAFTGNDLAFLGLMQSLPFAGLASLKLAAADAAARSYEVGLIQGMPVPKSIEKLEHLGIEAIRAKRFGSINDETNHYFVTASLCRHRSMSVADAVSEYEAGRLEAEEIINKCQLNLNQIAFALYGIEGDDRLSLQRSAAEIKTGDDIVDSNESEDRSSIALPQSIRHAQELISYMVGCVMGRWDIRFTTGEKDCTSLPGPFEPLPVRSPGMLHVGVETSLDKSFKSYPLETAISGLLPDDPDHLKDLTLRIRDALEFVWK